MYIELNELIDVIELKIIDIYSWLRLTRDSH